MKDVKRSEYKMAREWGFKPRNKVQHSISKKHYFLSDNDYKRYKKVVNSRIVESFTSN